MADENKVNFQNTDTSRLAKMPARSSAKKAPELPLSQADKKSVRPIQDPMDKRTKATVKLKPISASETGQIPVDTGADISDTVKLRVLKEKRRPEVTKQTVRVKTPSAASSTSQIREINSPSEGNVAVSDDTARIKTGAAPTGKTLKLTPAPPAADKTLKMKTKASPNKTLKLTPATGGSKTLKLKQNSDDMDGDSEDITSTNLSLAPLPPTLGNEMGGFLTFLNIVSFAAVAATLTFVLWSFIKLDYFC